MAHLTPKELTTWIAQYGTDYFAHAIWGNNVAHIFARGTLIPAEASLRQYGEVSYEAGTCYGERAVLNIQTLLNPQHPLHQEPVHFSNVDQITLENAARWGLITYEEITRLYKELQSSTCSPLVVALNKTSTTETTEYRTLQCVQQPPLSSVGYDRLSYYAIPGFPSCTIAITTNEETKRYTADIRPHRSSGYVNVLRLAQDQKLQEKFDDRLAAIFNYYCQLKETHYPQISLKHIFQDLYELRQKMFGCNKLNTEIRGLIGCIAWAYGNVIILKGNPLVSQYIAQNGEGYLRHPIENNGKFLTLPLDEADTLILGPRRILEAHPTVYCSSICFEDMTEEQLNFFKVPACLRMTHSALLAVDAIPLNQALAPLSTSLSGFFHTAVAVDASPAGTAMTAAPA